MTKKSEKILIIDDDRPILEMLLANFKEEGYENVDKATNVKQAIDKLDKKYYNLTLIDLKLPDGTGLDILKYIKETAKDIISIMFTGYGTMESAIESLKMGAYDYITKPFHIDELLSTISRALEHRQLKNENLILRKEVKDKYDEKNIIGTSQSIQDMHKLIHTVADSDSTILILGESGTGKELVAKALHYHSRRSEKPLIPVNCGAIPEDLLESELFGYVKGAFTGANFNKLGRFQLANSGTIFLDEIGDMSPKLQVKVLRVLQGQEFEPVGSVESVKVDVRIIAATNKNLEKVVEEKKFREDLYYRLNVIPIHIPPLRERKCDIPLLIDHFLEKFNKLKEKNVKGFTDKAMSLLMSYNWPGNVRELENLIERLIILKSEGWIDERDLPSKISGIEEIVKNIQIHIPDGGVCFNSLVNEFEQQLILQALHKTNFVKNKAAKLLNLKRTTLVEKVKKLKIERISKD